MSSYRAVRFAGRLLIALCLLAAPSLATNAFAEREAGSFGGQGGALFRGTCSPKALAGVFLRAGKALDTVMIDCGTLNKNGTVTDVIGDAHFHAGGSGGDPFGSVGQFCPQNALVTGMRVWKDHNNMVNSFFLRCTSMTDGTNTWTSMRAGGEAIEDPVKILCKNNEIGIGIYGRAGSLIDNLGLLCADNPMLVAAEPPAPPPPPAKPIKHTGRGNACIAYGDRMTATASEARSLGCKFVQVAPWNNPHDYWVQRCVAHSGDGVADSEEAKFKQRLNDCTAAGGDSEEGSAPLSPSPVNAGAGDAGGGGDIGGAPSMQQADGSCGGGTATVVIKQPGLDKLNVRNGPSGQVVGTVPEGDTVSVIGPCGAAGGAGFAKPRTQQSGGRWCQISAPLSGCVSVQFLEFGGGAAGFAKSAAGFAKSKGKPQAAATATFGGSWSANADNVAYSLSLKQNGNGVSGRYQGDDGSAGKINGKVAGNVLRFSWVQRDGTRGSGKFVLADDGQSFAGNYNFGNDPDAVEGSWNGRRQ